MISTESPWQRL